MTAAHLQVQITLSLDESFALERLLHGGVASETTKGIGTALSKQLGLASAALIATGATV